MDWGVIFDGFMLLMAVVSTLFLLYGLKLVIDYLIGDRLRAALPTDEQDGESQRMEAKP